MSKEYHCPTCNKLLLIGIFSGWVEAFCPRCRKRRKFVVNDQ